MNTPSQPLGYLDILFAHRNKTYGAYELRHHYNRRMITAGIITAGLALLLCVWLNRQPLPAETVFTVPQVTDTITTQIETLICEQHHIVPSGHSGRTARTDAFTLLEIVPDATPEVRKPLTKMPDKEALAGPVDNIGLPDGTAIALDHHISAGGTGVLSREGLPMDSALSTGGGTIPATDNAEPELWADEMPAFPGGASAWNQYLQHNLRYPFSAREAGIQGTVYVSFVVEKDGHIGSVQVVKGLSGGCSEEAVRVLQAAPHWKAGKQGKYPVRVKMTLPVRFALN